MNCKSCGEKMIYVERDYAPDTFDCECGEWIEVSIAFNELKFRAEKAEGELKAIKARIEAVKITDLYEIKERNKEYGCEDMQEIYHLIKQIGGEK